MNATHDPIDADSLRAQLMAPAPMQRVCALHALEVEASHAAGTPNPRLAIDVERFTARGIPYYAPHDTQYRSWVDRAVAYWERLHRDPASA